MQDKNTISKIVYIILVAMLALAAVFGYDIGVIQPREMTQIGGSRAAGVNVRTEKALIVENYIEDNGTLNVDGNATVGGTLAVTGAQTQTGLLNADGGIAVDTTNFTVSGTTGAVTTASSLSVGGGFGSTGCTLSAAGILQCDGATSLGSTLLVTGTSTLASATVNGGVTASGGITTTTARATGAISIEGAASVTGTLTSGAHTTNGGITASGGITSTTGRLTGALSVEGATTITGTTNLLGAVGPLTVNGGITASGGITSTTARLTGDASIEGNTAITGTLASGTNTTNGGITASGGITSTTARLTGAGSIEGALSITGTTTLTGDLVPTNIKPSAAGSAAAAIYCMSSDCDTGLWYQGDNIIGIAAGGVEHARVTTSGLQVTGEITTSTGITIGTFLRLWPGATQTLYEGTPITPTASYQPVMAIYNMGTSAIVIQPAGTLLQIINVGTPTVSITDTGTIMLSGDLVLGQYDSLLLLSDGTNWVQMGTSNN